MPNQIAAPYTPGTPQPGNQPQQAAGTMTQAPGFMWGTPSPYAAGALANPHGQPTALGGVQTTAQPPSNSFFSPNNPQNAFSASNATQPPGINIDPNILNSLSQYQNAAYQNQVSRLDPMWQQQKNAFDQQMISQGFQPGSAGYNAAYDNFMRGRNDAYNQAYNNSFQTGLQAQGQAFGQSALPYELQNARDVASINAAGNVNAAGVSANASMHNADINNATNQLLGLGNLGLGLNAQDMQQGQYDFSNLMSMLGMGNQQNMYNNSLVGGAQNTLLGLVPNGNPTPVDVTGAYGLNQAGQQTAYQGQVANANAQNQMYGSLAAAAIAMMMMCSHEFKDDEGEADPNALLDAVNSLPIHHWRYKGDETPHVGTFAEEFNEALGLPKSKTIAVIDILGAILGSVQALTKRIESLEARGA